MVVEHSHLLLFLSTTRPKPSRLHSTRARRLTVLRNIRALPLRRQFILESPLRPTSVGGRERTAPTDVELTVVLVYRNRVLSEASTGLFEAALESPLARFSMLLSRVNEYSSNFFCWSERPPSALRDSPPVPPASL